MKEFPKGWELTQLGSISDCSRRVADVRTARKSPYIGLEHIESRTNRILGTGNAAKIKSGKIAFKSGDVLFGKLRPNLRKVCRPGFSGVCSTDILVYPASEVLVSDYLLHFLSQRSTAEFAAQNASGINLPRITEQVLATIPFPLAPLAEQRRISDVLGGIRQRILRASEIIADTLPLIERYRDTIRSAAVRGDLTRAWRLSHSGLESGSTLLARIGDQRREEWERAELRRYDQLLETPPSDWRNAYIGPESSRTDDLPALPSNWCWASLEEIQSSIRPVCYGVVQPGQKVKQGVPLVRVVDLVDGAVATENLRTISKDVDLKYKRSRLEGGELLISLVGTVGRIAIVQHGAAGANIARAIGRIVPIPLIPVEWLALVFTERRLQGWFAHGTREVARKTLNLSILSKAAIPVAPPEEMDRILRIVHGHDESTKQLAAVLESTSQALDAVSNLRLLAER